MRKIKINSSEVTAGYISQGIGERHLIDIPLYSWINWYHVPGKFDWAEATRKAEERKNG